MLARVENNKQVRKFIVLFFVCKKGIGVFCKSFVAVELENTEHDLRVDASHPKGLHEAAETLFNMLFSEVLAIKVSFHARFG